MTAPGVLAATAAKVFARAVDAGDCIHWTGAIDPRGYGRVRMADNSKTVLTHRIVAEWACGSIPDGLVVDHACHSNSDDCTGGPACLHRRCINPEHLEVVSFQENVARGWPARKTTCQQGHPYDEKNTGRNPRGYRRCRRCNADRETARYHAKRAAANIKAAA